MYFTMVTIITATYHCQEEKIKKIKKSDIFSFLSLIFSKKCANVQKIGNTPQIKVKKDGR